MSTSKEQAIDALHEIRQRIVPLGEASEDEWLWTKLDEIAMAIEHMDAEMVELRDKSRRAHNENDLGIGFWGSHGL